jgi:large subunit ribosomal protein L4
MPQRRKKAVVKRAVKKTAGKKVSAKKAPTRAKAKKAVEAKPKIGQLSVYDLSGKSVDTLTLDPMFHEGEVNTDVLHQAIVMYQAGQREGTAATKTRGEVSGGGKKPWKQKGTGRARHASIRSPLWTGGGTVFGPHPRDYSYSIPAQLRRLAVAEGVKAVASTGKLTVLKELTLEKPKTKLVAKILKTFKAEKPLFVVDKKSDNFVLASRNLPNVCLKTADEVNALDIVSHKECLITQGAYTGLLKRLKS